MPLAAKWDQRRLIIGVVTSVALIACSAPPDSAGPGALPATQNRPTAASAISVQPSPVLPPPPPVTLDYGITGMLVSYWIDFVGLSKGFFTTEGVNLDLVLTETSARSTTALAGGSLDLSNNSPDSSILAVEKGADLVIVGEELARPVYTLLGQPTIQSVSDLRGQRVGVSDLKSGATIVLLRTLALYGVGPNDVDLIPAGGTSARYAALKSGAIAAAAMLQPDDFRAIDEGFHRLAVSTEAVKLLPFNSVVVRRDWARAHAAELVRFLRAFRQSADWLYDPANREEAIAILVERTKVEDQHARRTYDLAVTQERIFAEHGRISLEGLETMLDMLAETGDLSRPLPSPTKYVDTTFWDQAEPH
jgi:NitT/TauT family transport system substrate-binding protein